VARALFCYAGGADLCASWRIGGRRGANTVPNVGVHGARQLVDVRK